MLWRELIGYETISWWRDRSLHQFWKNKLNFWHSNNKIRTTWKLFKKCVILFMAISSKSAKFSRNKNNFNHLKSQFHRFLGILYYCIPLLLVLAGMICSSIDITSSGSTFKQFGCTISSNGRTLNSLSCFFHLLMSCQRDQLNYINLYISSLIMWQQLY